ncbi:MAG: CocE/NonD family hydrolase, partial [bacterium]|nr:CocE/NonD family hydrolase [bacterium]
QRGYAVVIQDTRGRFESEGVFSPFYQEIDDADDTLDWLAGREFCDGNVVMAGSSYLGATQWLAALSGNEHLKAIAPTLTASDYHEGWTYQGGAFQLAFNLFWALVHLLPEEQRRRGIEPSSAPTEPAYRDNPDDTSFAATASHSLDVAGPWLEHLPLGDIPPLVGVADFYFDWLANPDYTLPDWEDISPERNAGLINCPALITSGWYQLFLRGAYEGFRAITVAGGSEVARTQSRMVIGPWENSLPGPKNTVAGVEDFGPRAGIDFTSVQLDFFDEVLGRAEPQVHSPVKYFVMGANEWRSSPSWPPTGAGVRNLFLAADGRLGDAPSTDAIAFDETTHDPLDPVPTLGGCTVPGIPQGPQDHASLAGRSDCVTYRTEPLEEPLEIIGPVTATIHASCDRPSSDFTVMLSVERPDGTVINICDGINRWRGPPGELTVQVDMLATAIRIAPGERLHVRVGHSNFPRFDRNLGTGEPIESAVRAETAHHRIYRGSARASFVSISVQGQE